MDHTKRGHKFQFYTLLYFVISSLLLGQIIGILGFELGIIPNVIISQIFMVFLVVLVFFYITGAPIKETISLKPLPLVEVLMCVAIAWCIMPLLSFINVASQFFVENQVTDLMASMMDFPFLLAITLTAVFPAVFEELLTRALIISNYKKHSVMIVCLLSGAFFGFIHMNINQFLYAFVMGLLMCYIVMVTQSLLSSMIIHFTVNASGITMLYLLKAAMSRMDDSGLLFEDMMATQQASTTTSQLLLSLVLVFFAAAFFTPIAAILINILLSRHGKTFKGSLKLPTEVFMNTIKQPLSGHTFNEDIDIAMSQDHSQPPLSTQKLITPLYISTIILFIGFAIGVEILTKLAA